MLADPILLLGIENEKTNIISVLVGVFITVRSHHDHGNSNKENV